MPYVENVTHARVASQTRHSMDEGFHRHQTGEGTLLELHKALTVRSAPLRIDQQRRHFSLNSQLLVVLDLFKNGVEIILVRVF